MRPNPLLMTVMGNPCHSNGGYQANPFVLIDSQTNKIIRTWRGSMMDRKPWDWAADAARRLGRPVFVVAHPYVPKTFRAGIEVSPLFYAGGGFQEVRPDGSTGPAPSFGYRRNSPGFFPSMAGGIAGTLVANAVANPKAPACPQCGSKNTGSEYKGEWYCYDCGNQWNQKRGRSGSRTIKARSNPVGRRRKVTMTLQKFAEYIKKKGDPKLWNDFVRKIKGYQRWTHGSLPKNVTIEVVDKPGVSGLWMTYDAGRVPESAYVMPKGSKRKGAWKHPWETMPRIKHDPDAGIIMHKLSGRSKVTDFYHK